MKRAYIAANYPDATLVAGLLEHNDIFAEIRGGEAAGLQWEVPMTSYPEVWVEEKDFEKARELIERGAE